METQSAKSDHLMLHLISEIIIKYQQFFIFLITGNAERNSSKYEVIWIRTKLRKNQIHYQWPQRLIYCLSYN